MLESLITSKTRIKLLLKFFLNQNTQSYLRSLENEFGESTNAIRQELNRFEDAGLLRSEMVGNKKIFKANTNHPLFNDIHNILMKTIGIDRIIEQVISRIGDLKEAYLIGDLAKGKDCQVIDLLLVGEKIDKSYVAGLATKVEKLINRQIRFIVLTGDEKKQYLQNAPSLLIWKEE